MKILLEEINIKKYKQMKSSTRNLGWWDGGIPPKKKHNKKKIFDENMQKWREEEEKSSTLLDRQWQSTRYVMLM